MIRNLPATRETWVRSLGWEGPLEKGKATHSKCSGLEEPVDSIIHGVTKSRTQLSDFHFTATVQGDQLENHVLLYGLVSI